MSDEEFEAAMDAAHEEAAREDALVATYEASKVGHIELEGALLLKLIR
jgi:hypothetical protein